MSPEQRDRLWKAAYSDMQTWTQVVSTLPPLEHVKKVSLRAVRKAAYGEFPAHVQLPEIADEIANWIYKHFDPKKRRPPPKTSRADRESADRKIVAAYMEGQASSPPLSMRDIAGQQGVSVATVSRAWQKYGDQISTTTPPSSAHSDLVNAVRLLAKILPRDGKRAIDAGLLSKNLGIAVEDLWSFLREISASGRWYFYPHMEEVLICRGRKSSPAEMASWRIRAKASSVVAPKRQLQDHGRAVWGDMLSIFAVWSGNASSDDWQEFLQIVTVTPAVYATLEKIWIDEPELSKYSTVKNLISADPIYMSNRVRSALQNHKRENQFRSIGEYNKEHHRDSVVLGEIMYIVEVTSNYDFEEAAIVWLRVCSYECRAKFGLLPGRLTEHIPLFLQVARDFDADLGTMEDLLAECAAQGGRA